MQIVDLRSDTITKPTPSMRQAMANADVGDDVFGEDPTLRRLEEMAAERMGKEAAVFVASGTMANLVSLLTHCGRGDEVILGDGAHIFLNEQGGISALGGIHPRIIPNQPDGTLAISAIESAIRSDNIHFPRTRLVALENTHNRCHGFPLSNEYMDSVYRIAKTYGLRVHVDGARIFNAAVALGISPDKLVEKADSVSFCLSKGLAAPVGSLVCGSREFISESRRNRKVLGGGMRQAGVLAAAGIVALTEMVDRLEEDHAHARKLAEGLAELNGITVFPACVKTNIVYIRTLGNPFDAQGLVKRLNERGVRVLSTGPQDIRAVTNYHISASDIDYVLNIFREILRL